jgi:selenocysteine lyase/cysteine desulfurase
MSHDQASVNTSGGGVAVSFGKDMRKKHFLFDDGYINLNQGSCYPWLPEMQRVLIGYPGSFGCYPRPVREALRSFQDEGEAKPDRFIRYTYPDRLNEIRATLAKILNAATDEIVIVPNASIAINTVLRNFSFSDGDKIVYLGPVYGAVKKTLQYLAESTPVQTVELDFMMPISDDDLAQRFQAILREHGPSVKFAVFDTIVSMPGVKMPYELLTRICRENGVLSLVDAAHGIGHIPLDISSFRPDFLLTNCHK